MTKPEISAQTQVAGRTHSSRTQIWERSERKRDKAKNWFSEAHSSAM